MYEIAFVEEALSILWEPNATVQMAREPGMPSSAADPRKAQDPHVMMIDVKRAWDDCTWLSLNERRAVFAYAICGTQDAAAALLGTTQSTISVRCERALTLLTTFLNSTVADREQWEQDLADYAKYGQLNAVRDHELRLLAAEPD